MDYSEPLARYSALWGDQYALTMAQAFFTNGRHNQRATFHAFIRQNPFKGGYLITAGQNIIFEWLRNHWKFDAQDIALMKRKTVADAAGNPTRLFTDDFINMISAARLELSIDAMPEGEIAFPDEPILRVHGPLWQCLMVEAAILNAINSQSLFATLASRLVDVAGGPVLEFGLRRAQGLGGLEPSRGAWIGGVTGTSNMLAEKYYNIPSSGTFAHALVMTYEDELGAFREYARAMPHNGVFLVDTYNSLEGVRRAVKACTETGTNLRGIRLDSGDLTYLSKEARKILNASPFKNALIVASNDLDEDTIAAIRQEGGQIDVWGVGTNLATSRAQPALGAVYKLGAVYGDEGAVRDVLKLSEQPAKISLPGELDVLRFMIRNGNGELRYDGDTIFSASMADIVKDDTLTAPIRSIRKNDDTRIKIFPVGTQAYRPLKPAFRDGKIVCEIETVHDARERAARGLAMLHPTHRRLKNPHLYIVGLEEGLYEKRRDMIRSLRA